MEEGVWWQGITNSTDVRWEHEPSGSCPCKAERPQGRAVPLGAGGLLGGMGLGEGTCVGKGAAWPLHHGGQGRQEYGSPAARGVPVRVLEMGLEAGAVTCWNRAWGSVSPWL